MLRRKPRNKVGAIEEKLKEKGITPEEILSIFEKIQGEVLRDYNRGIYIIVVAVGIFLVSVIVMLIESGFALTGGVLLALAGLVLSVGAIYLSIKSFRYGQLQGHKNYWRSHMIKNYGHKIKKGQVKS